MSARRITIGSVGWTGHTFPALALGRELRARGHTVTVETFERWRETVERLGLGFLAAPERLALPGLREAPGAPTLADAARDLAPALADLGTELVVHDMYTLAPALAAEAAGLRRATLIPHPYPVREPGLPFYPLGLMPPRTVAGSLAWRAMWPAVGTRLPNTRLAAVRAALDRSRAELALGPLADYDGQISDRLAIVATFPQLEYPRRWPFHVHVTGPLPFELPHPEIELPAGEEPLVVIASSTERDPALGLLRTTLEALADEPLRVVASVNRPRAATGIPAPANALVVEWLSYSQVLARASVVVCHGGHGTVARALAAGVPVIVCPPAGDMAETGARVTWAGAGLMVPWRLLAPASIRLAVRRALGEDLATTAGALADWARRNDGAGAAADLVEGLLS